MDAIKKHWPWVPTVVLAAILLMMAFPKLTGAQATIDLFGGIDAWMGASSLFEPYLRYLIGLAELVGGILVLIPSQRVWGTLIAFVIIIGALFFHLVGPLYPAGDVGDPSIFMMALIVLVACVILLYLDKARLPLIGSGETLEVPEMSQVPEAPETPEAPEAPKASE